MSNKNRNRQYPQQRSAEQELAETLQESATQPSTVDDNGSINEQADQAGMGQSSNEPGDLVKEGGDPAVQQRGETPAVVIMDEAAFQAPSIVTDNVVIPEPGPGKEITETLKDDEKGNVATTADRDLGKIDWSLIEDSPSNVFPPINHEEVDDEGQTAVEIPSLSIQPTTQQSRIMKSVERDLISYMEAVHPKNSITVESGAAWQGSLAQTFKRITNNPDPEVFKVEWNTLLAFFHKHSQELFNENFMFRFLAGWKGSPTDYNRFRHLTFLAMQTANPQTRQKAAREIILEKITQGLTPQAAANITSFYS